ncbi:MAG: AAA family ATPase [Rikenellaceae bacterium]
MKFKSLMEKKKPIRIAFSTQKGGVGKTTFTVLVASYLHYAMGKNVLVVDCDYPQFSIYQMRERDSYVLDRSVALEAIAIEQFSKIEKPTYEILCAAPEDAIAELDEHLQESEEQFDFVLFDLPGTFNNDGVINTLAQVDYIFTPIAADSISLESTISFAIVLKDELLGKSGDDASGIRLKSIHLFWNMVDGREKTDLYTRYGEVIGGEGLPILKTRVPMRSRYKKEVSTKSVDVFRSSIFSPSRHLLKGSMLAELVDEILVVTKGE